jgi:hypothetical protein
MSDDLRRKGTKVLVRIGKMALDDGNQPLAMIIAGLLAGRRPKAAAKGMQLRGRATLGSHERPRAETSTREPFGDLLGVVKNAEIEPRREALIARAKHSIWVSSFTPPSASLVDLLIRMAREVWITLVLDRKTLRGPDYAACERLARAGVRVRLLENQHSKLVIVDQEYFMNGSANLKRVGVDIADVQRDRKKAREFIDYLDGLR